MAGVKKSGIRILVLEGDGIGPEIAAATLTVLRAADRAFDLGLSFEQAAIGWAAHRREGTTFPLAVLEQARAADGVLLGPVSHNEYPPTAQGGLNPSGDLRRRLDLYANIRPAKSRRPAAALRRAGRSRHRAGEHGRFLRGSVDASRAERIHADAGSRAVRT